MMNITILGAGLAGLSAAYHLNAKYEIYESEKEAGGLCRSIKENGFVIDYGPHLFFSKNEYVCKFINALLKKNLHELESSVSQYSFGHYLKYPYNVNLHGAPVEIIKECISGYVNARHKVNKKKPENYHDWCLYNFGKGYAKHFMIPYAKKNWTVNPKRMTTEWVGKRIFMPTLEQILEGALHRSESKHNYISSFRYPLRGGMSSMIAGLVKKAGRIHYNKKAVRIDVKTKKILFQDGTSVHYEKTISTIPLPEMIRMIPDAPASIHEAAKRLINNSVYIINIGVDRPRLSDHHWIYYDGDEPFHRIHFPSMLSEFNSPHGAGIVSAEIAYSRFRPLNKENLFDLTLDKLKGTGILRSSDRVIYHNTIDLKYAYVIYDHHRKVCVKTVRDFLRKHGIETCGRFGEWGYLWMDQTILSGKRVAEAITGWR
jgi:UDP-galactopyranose mutase